MTAGTAASVGIFRRMGRFGTLGLLLLAILVSGFATEMLINSQAVVGSFERQNTHDLAVIAKTLENRQRDFARLAQTNHSRKGGAVPSLPHPYLGSIGFSYSCDASLLPDRDRLFPRSSAQDDDDQYRVSGEFYPASQPDRLAARPAPRGRPVCYTVSVSLRRLISLASTAPSLTNALIVTADGTILEQLGTESLPIARLPQLEAEPILGDDLRKSLLPGGASSAPPPPSQVAGLAASAGTARLTINGEEYRGYIRPFRLTAPPDICRSAVEARTPAVIPNAGARAASPSPTADDDDDDGATGAPATRSADCQLFLVGLTPASVARTTGLMPPRLALVGFSLALAFIVALLPLGRLLLINHTETISGLGVLVIILGLVAATAIGTVGLLFVGEITAERRLAANEASAVASSIAAGTGRELAALEQASRACRGDPGAGSQAPTVIDGTYINREGLLTSQPLSCPMRSLAAASVQGRPYFEALKRLPDSNDESVLDQLVSQTDGLDKTVLARHGARPRKQLTDDRFAIRVATIIRSLIAPTLPPHEMFMVVDTGGDTGSDELRVLFHSRRSRAGAEKLGDQIDQPSRTAIQLRHLVAVQHAKGDHKPEVAAFASRYDGLTSHFAAASIPGKSNWVVLVYFPVDKVDVIAATTTLRALLTWISFSILVLLAIGLALLFAPRDAWRALWPSEDHADRHRRGADEYNRLAVEGTVASVLVILATTLLATGRSSRLFDIMPIVAIVVATAFVIRVFRRLGGRRLSAEPLAQSTERAYLCFVLAMLACVGAAPMVAFWADSRAFSRAEVQIQRTTAARAAQAVWAQRVDALVDTLAKNQILPATWTPRSVGVRATNRSERERGLTAMMLWVENGVAPATFDRCDVSADAPQQIGADHAWYCALGHPVAAVERPAATPPLLGWMTVLILAAALAIIIHSAVAATLEALTGFGIPLGAVTWPRLLVDQRSSPGKNQLKLTRKALLVAPQQAVRDRLAMLPRALPVNLADQLLSAPDETLRPAGNDPPGVPTPWKNTNEPATAPSASHGLLARLGHRTTSIRHVDLPARTPAELDGDPDPPGVSLIVSGLELVLRDALRRRAALAYLERAVGVLAINGQTELARVTVIAEMSPLERILDAFESFAENDEVRLSTREELRWARLFQDFTTFYFAPIDKVDDTLLDGKITGPTHTLIEELRWLPGSVIDGVIADHSSRRELTGNKQPADKSFPLAAEAYRRHYTPLIQQWADSLDAKTDEAAIDYMRANLIEYYEQCWAASSFAERVILDAIARRSFINMRKAIAMQSLVRRGLVILDPAPRLMNESFALYLRQNERPDTLARWKALQPRSTWSVARLPLALLLPALLILLSIAAAESGQSLGSLFPLLAAGLPAAVSLLVRSAKSS